MKEINISKGLDIPINGTAAETVDTSKQVQTVALLGDDYPGMKPTMLVTRGDSVKRGTPLFTDKKNPGVMFTAPGGGTVTLINRGPKRKFESIVIALDERETAVSFCPPNSTVEDFSDTELRKLLVDSGLWTALRTRPYGKIPAITTTPSSLFITAIDTSPLAPDPAKLISMNKEDFRNGLALLGAAVNVPLFLCFGAENKADFTAYSQREGVEPVAVSGPHPAGLPSTHIHFLDPVHENKTVWHIAAQDVICCGALLRTGTLVPERIITLAGPGAISPRHIKTRIGASVSELCLSEIHEKGEAKTRLISGSLLDGRAVTEMTAYLGRYHQQISCLPEETGREFFGWLRPGNNRFSITRAFLSSFTGRKSCRFNSAVWGGTRALFPLGTYEKVMPLDIMPTHLLKSLASGDTAQAKELGCLELIEEDVALCSYVCPGKNNFGPLLRNTLISIEKDG